MSILWGLKTIAAFDVWTLDHILSGISIGQAFISSNKKHAISNKINVKTLFRIEIWGLLSIAFLWETIEHYLETGLLGSAIEFWFQGVEFWMNRLITDPLMLVLGYYIAKRYPVLVIPARITSVIWLFVHIFIFPHSMYLHTIF